MSDERIKEFLQTRYGIDADVRTTAELSAAEQRARADMQVAADEMDAAYADPACPAFQRQTRRMNWREMIKQHELRVRELSFRLRGTLFNIDGLMDSMLTAMRSQPQTAPFGMQEVIERDFRIELALANPANPTTVATANKPVIEAKRTKIF